MKPKIGIKSFKFMWKDCRCSFVYRKEIPIFSTGGGSYQDFGFSDRWHCQKHFYFYKWCFLTVKYVKEALFTRRKLL